MHIPFSPGLLCSARYMPLLAHMHPISRHPPTPLPAPLLPHMCLWNENVLTGTVDALLHNGVVAMAAVYLIVAWQLWRAHQDRHRD
jgi:hypothetical protein